MRNKLSIVIPAHNEARRIGKTLEEYGKFFWRKYGREHEIIVVLNGCEDGTLDVVKRYERLYPSIKHIEFKRGGKGFAVSEGFKAARGELVGFSDADNATNPVEFEKLAEGIGNWDGIIGSRWMEDSVVVPKQPLLRRIFGRTFNFIVRLLFGLKFKDTQCGAKIFTNGAAKSVVQRLKKTEWAFDVDLLYEMKVGGFKIKEMGIAWNDIEGSKLNVTKTPIRMFLSLVRLRLVYSPFKFVIGFYDNVIPEWMKIHHTLK